MGAESGPSIFGANVLYENRSGRKRSQYQSLPKALASLHSLIRRLPHLKDEKLDKKKRSLFD